MLAVALLSLLPLSRPAHAQRETSRLHYWSWLAVGFGSSILLHESAHVVMARAVGGHPSFGFDRGRPTIYSGIDADVAPHRQLLFSSAGLTAQMLLNEALLDVPHARGAPLERGLLAGGIATVAFYISLGRNDRVSDVSFIARTSGLTKGEVSLIYGAIAGVQALRIARDARYANFFARPGPDGRVVVGARVATR